MERTGIKSRGGRWRRGGAWETKRVKTGETLATIYALEYCRGRRGICKQAQQNKYSKGMQTSTAKAHTESPCVRKCSPPLVTKPSPFCDAV